MSKWMSIGFDPDQMDLATEPDARADISGAAAPAELRATSPVKGTRTHRIAGAFKHLIARRTTPVPSS